MIATSFTGVEDGVFNFGLLSTNGASIFLQRELHPEDALIRFSLPTTVADGLISMTLGWQDSQGDYATGVLFRARYVPEDYPWTLYPIINGRPTVSFNGAGRDWEATLVFPDTDLTGVPSIPSNGDGRGDQPASSATPAAN